MDLSKKAEPFGLSMGMKLEQIEGDSQKVKQGMYLVEKVPLPHSAFTSYCLRIGPQNGLSWISAFGREIHTNHFGTQLISVFEDMRGRLEDVYGNCKVINQLVEGSALDSEKDFMNSLNEQERMLTAAWRKEDGANLDVDLVYVGLVAHAKNSRTGFISVDYKFINDEACEAEIREMEDEVL